MELGREATKEELAEASGIPLQHVEEALAAAVASVSLNKTMGEDDDGEFSEFFADRSAPDPYDETEDSLLRQSISKALEGLPEREQTVLKLRYGFEEAPWPLEKVGKKLGLTRERVRQIENKALKILAGLPELQSLTDKKT